MDTVKVTFHLEDGTTYGGEIKRLAIVHEAMEKFLPQGFMHERRITVTEPGGDLIYPDMFVGEVHDHYGSADLKVTARPISERAGEWRNVGFDHLALSVKDRKAAVDFFCRGLQMQVIRDDDHISVVTTGNTALFFFDAEPGQPLTDGVPSRIHHIGFVVDDLEAAYHHLRSTFPAFTSDFTLLERLERWSMYGKITFDGVTFMIQLSQIKEGFKGFENPREYADIMYNYASRQYGIRFMPG
jgi:hypothetical protein